jgi:hypothetical protein
MASTQPRRRLIETAATSLFSEIPDTLRNVVRILVALWARLRFPSRELGCAPLTPPESSQTCTRTDGSAWRYDQRGAVALADKIYRSTVSCLGNRRGKGR